MSSNELHVQIEYAVIGHLVLSFELKYVSCLQLVSRLNHLGGTLDPHACFLLQRGLKTLPLRVRQQSANALALAQFLEKQPQVMFV